MYIMKRQYEKPAMRVVVLLQRQHLLTVSGEISGYSKSGSGFSQDDGGGSSSANARSGAIWDNNWSNQ